MKKIQLTKEGLENLQKEYQELKDKTRPVAVERLQKARAMGDLKENSEYTAAKEELALVEGRIHELEVILKNVEITEHPANAQIVEIGSAVSVESNGEKNEFLIVGEFEADPMNKKLSHTSPIGKALLGKAVGDIIEVDVPAGKITYRILSIR